MEASAPTRILIVANRTAAAHRLLEEVGRRAKAGPAEFTLLRLRGNLIKRVEKLGLPVTAVVPRTAGGWTDWGPGRSGP